MKKVFMEYASQCSANSNIMTFMAYKTYLKSLHSENLDMSKAHMIFYQFSKK